MRRTLTVVVLIALIAIVYFALSVGFVLALAAIASQLPTPWQHALGVDSQATHQYAFTSGPGPMIVAMLGFSGVLGFVWSHFICHRDGCYSYGRFPVAGGQFRTCRAHHPDPAVREGRITTEHLAVLHERHHKGR